MIRGTTPTHNFTLPFEPPEGTEYRIVYAQGEEYKETIILEITTDQCEVEGTVLSTRLTQEQTLLFDQTPHWQKGVYVPYPIKIQVGVKTPGGDTLWGNIIETTVDRCLLESGVV